MKDWRVVVVAILAIVWLEIYALYQGIDGAALSMAVAAIAGLGGFTLKGILGR